MTDPNATTGLTGTSTPVGAHTAPIEGTAARVVPPVRGDEQSSASSPNPSNPSTGPGGMRLAERVEAWTELVASQPMTERVERAMTGAADRLLPPGSSWRAALSGSWLGQSLHPILNDVPTGLWTSASVLDVISWRRSAAASRRLIGLGLLTAIPTAASGMAELSKLDERGRRVATVHAGLNLATMLLYLRSYGARLRRKHLRGALWALAGAAVATAAGVVGGELAKSLGGQGRRAVEGDATHEAAAVDLGSAGSAIDSRDVPPV